MQDAPCYRISHIDAEMADRGLFHNRCFILSRSHIGKALEAFGEVLGIIEMEQVGDLGNIIISLPDQLPRLFDL